MTVWSTLKTGAANSWKVLNGTLVNEIALKLVSNVVSLNDGSILIAKKVVSPVLLLFIVILVQNLIIFGGALPLLQSSKSMLQTTTMRRKSDALKVQKALYRTEIANELLVKSTTAVLMAIAFAVFIIYMRIENIKSVLEKN